jgi:hypothetical protein
VNRVQLLEVARQAKEEGDIETGLRAMELYNSMPKDLTAGEKVGGALEVGAAIGSGMIAEPIAGIAGVIGSAFPGEEGQGADIVESVRDTLTVQPSSRAGKEYMQNVGDALAPVTDAISGAEQGLGEFVLEKTGSPAAAAAAHTIPTAMLEALGWFGGKALSKAPEQQAKLRDVEAAKLQGQVDELRTDNAQPREYTQEAGEKVAETLTKASEEDLAALVNADPELYDAFDRLGIVGEIPAELTSRNPQFMEVAGGLRSVPGAQLRIPYNDTIEQVSKRADSIIEELGGTNDRALLSDRFLTQSKDNINDLYEAETAIYNGISETNPALKRERFEPSNTINLISRELDDVGGNPKDLPAYIKPIYGRLSTKEDGALPTYGLFSNERQRVGSQVGKKMDQIEEFKGAEAGKLKNLYAAMKEDQSKFMRNNGLESEMSAADQLTIKRKGIQENLKDILGNGLTNNLMSVVESKTKGLATKAEVAKFTETMKKIPEQFRQEAAISALGSLFRGSGAGQSGYSANQTFKNLDKLYRSPTAKNALLRELPEPAAQMLNDLYKISKQIQKTSNNTIKTGAIKLFDDDSGLINKLAGNALGAAATKATGSFAAGEAAKNAADAFSRKSPRAAAAANMMSDTDFQAMIRESVREGVAEGSEISRKLAQIEKKVESSAKFRRWSDTLSESDLLKLSNIGLINYLASEQDGY